MLAFAAKIDLMLKHMSKFIGLTPFIFYGAGLTIVLYSNLAPEFKKKLFRIVMITAALSGLIAIPLTGIEIEMMVFVVPALAWLTFGWIKWTKICEYCGWPVHTNFPNVNKETCEKCGGRLI